MHIRHLLSTRKYSQPCIINIPPSKVEWHAVEVESGKACLWIIMDCFWIKDRKKSFRQKTNICNALR